MKKHNNNKGITLTEVIISIVVMSIVLTGITKLATKAGDLRAMSVTMQQTDLLHKAFETTYRRNIEYVESTCYGWTNATCQNINMLPIKPGVGASTTLTLRTYSAPVVTAWQLAGCTVTVVAVPEYTVTCRDGYGKTIRWDSSANEHTANTLYTNGYARTPYTIAYTTGGAGSGTSDKNISVSWASGYLDAEFAEKNTQKTDRLIATLKAFHFSRLTHEAIVNAGDTVNGGIATSDDVIVPWAWQTLATTAAKSIVECTGIELSGTWGCSGFDNTVWLTDASYLTVDSATEFGVFITNLSLPTLSRVDAYGNPYTVRLFTGNSGAAVSIVPPRPRPNYYNCLAGGDNAQCGGLAFQPPPYRGNVGVWNTATSAWVNTEAFFYPQ